MGAQFYQWHQRYRQSAHLEKIFFYQIDIHLLANTQNFVQSQRNGQTSSVLES